ncbi:MAG: sodium:proton antiporter [Phycisphaerales bacterium]|nr:sodium:proton antiporter [Phycisphaerales bacterium]
MNGTLLTLAAADGSNVGITIGIIVVLGVGAQWLAWRLQVPSILLLLVFGILAGPVMRTLFPGSPLAVDPDLLFDSELLLAFVGVAVGLILYEGGLTLNFRELTNTWKPVTLLVTTGALVTWIVAGVSAKLIFGLDTQIAALLGAILIVTGPTVVGPLLAHIRPSGESGLILKWEGIVIDPIGILVAVLVFEGIVSGPQHQGVNTVITAIAMTLVVGIGFGLLSALILKELMGRFLVPDFLQNPVSLMLVVGTFTISNQVMHESGLLATTVMGIVLANQKKVNVHHILEFKENIRVLLIAGLFITLAANLRIEDLKDLDWFGVFIFLAVLIVIARPIAVFLATVGQGLKWQERALLAMVAPRGIVAAAGASIFSLGLQEAGIPGGEKLVPLTFCVIIGTVAFYGLTATTVARMLGVADQNPQGVIFIGAPRWVRQIATVLHNRGVSVLLIDTNRTNIRAAKMEHLNAENINVLTMGNLSDLDLRGIGRVIAATPNNEVNTLSLQRFKGMIETVSLYRLPVKATKKTDTEHSDSHWRSAFGGGADYAGFESRIANGWVVKATTISDEFSYESYQTLYGSSAILLCVINTTGALSIVSDDKPTDPIAGDTVIALVNPEELFMMG